VEVLRAGRVFDGQRLLEATDVVVEDGRVVAVNGPGAYPGGVTVTDHGPDATILPGLVDTHVHLTRRFSLRVRWVGFVSLSVRG
jgi:imidazolonepropionase-like amidohydrolase